MSVDNKRRFSVFYDGACPLCRREIAFYRARRGAETIEWVNLASEGAPDGVCDVSRSALLRRFHVRDEDGLLHNGAQAFAELWLRLPGFRWAGRLARTRAGLLLLEPLYRIFLKIRPLLQRTAA